MTRASQTPDRLRLPMRSSRARDHFSLASDKGAPNRDLSESTEPGALFTVLRIADLQRVDMGIAMCHFELVAREHGLDGRWLVRDPGSALPGEDTEYSFTWVAE